MPRKDKNGHKDGTGELYHVRASLMFTVKGAIGMLNSMMPRAADAGVITSIERMRINSAIVSLQSVTEEASGNWSEVIKPRLLEVISQQPTTQTNESEQGQTDDELRERPQASGQESDLPPEKPGDNPQ